MPSPDSSHETVASALSGAYAILLRAAERAEHEEACEGKSQAEERSTDSGAITVEPNQR